jgi:hypothetical protein
MPIYWEVASRVMTRAGTALAVGIALIRSKHLVESEPDHGATGHADRLGEVDPEDGPLEEGKERRVEPQPDPGPVDHRAPAAGQVSLPFDVLRELVDAGRGIASGFTATLGGFVHSLRSLNRLPVSVPVDRKFNALVVSWHIL